ncbi:hypothetical protein ANN_22069 [Periplaneta americana]|uniref:Tc1-like transposase DDE domain-containing protein n=1 Tax=Periplaneta americana TaxID=6978 RepID=A0ABQ8S7A2_PERAM|nr:hypothetical protein ANN_22069 [Periplaneta americana]
MQTSHRSEEVLFKVNSAHFSESCNVPSPVLDCGFTSDAMFSSGVSLTSKETLRGHSDSSFRGEGYIQCCVGVRLCDMYSNQELAEIHFIHGKADGNATQARHEAQFTRDGITNFHNRHIWAYEKPRATVPSHHQVRFSLNMWAGIIDDRLVGPHVLVNRLTGQAYTNFLENTIPHVLEDTPLINRQHIHFLRDGAPAHSENREDLELNGLHQLLVYRDDVNVLEEKTQTIKKTRKIYLKKVKRWISNRTHRHDTTVHDVIRLLIPALYKNQSDSLMAADGDCHHLCKLMAPVRHRWSINDVIGGIRNTVMPSDCSPHYLQIRTVSSQFTVLLAESLEFTVSRTTDLQRQSTVLELRSPQLRSTAFELRSLQLRFTALELRPSDADIAADAHSSRTPVHKTG